MTDTDRFFEERIATEKELRALLIEIGLQANENGLASFAVDEMMGEARRKLRSRDYDRDNFHGE